MIFGMVALKVFLTEEYGSMKAMMGTSFYDKSYRGIWEVDTNRELARLMYARLGVPLIIRGAFLLADRLLTSNEML